VFGAVWVAHLLSFVVVGVVVGVVVSVVVGCDTNLFAARVTVFCKLDLLTVEPCTHLRCD
jgi:hypothetical protein